MCESMKAEEGSDSGSGEATNQESAVLPECPMPDGSFSQDLRRTRTTRRQVLEMNILPCASPDRTSALPFPDAACRGRSDRHRAVPSERSAGSRWYDHA